MVFPSNLLVIMMTTHTSTRVQARHIVSSHSHRCVLQTSRVHDIKIALKAPRGTVQDR